MKNKIPFYDDLMDAIDGAKVIKVLRKGQTILAQWPDGSTAYLDLSGDRKDHWSFRDDNTSYRAGYNYACGYRD